MFMAAPSTLRGFFFMILSYGLQDLADKAWRLSRDIEDKALAKRYPVKELPVPYKLKVVK